MNSLSRWFQKRRVEREITAEIAEHLAEKIDQLREEGHTEAEARAIAHRQFGNVTLQQENSRAAWGWNAVEQLWQDIRFGCRVLAKSPAFTTTALVVLALGIGMNTAMFSAVKAVLLSALPYPEPERIVELGQTAKDGHVMNVSGPDFHDWHAQTRTIEYMAAYGPDAGTISGSFLRTACTHGGSRYRILRCDGNPSRHRPDI